MRSDTDRRFLWTLAAIAFGALVLRVVYVLVSRQHHEFGGDAFFYHEGANLLADGKGFISPFTKHAEQAGEHPPLYLVYLAIPSVFGAQSVLAHLLWSTLLGVGTVTAIGLAGREVAGERVGLIAAVLAAIYPNLWVPDGSLMAESMAMLTTAFAILFAYRYWRDPSVGRLALVGLAGGLGALSRSELLLVVPLMVVPLALLAPGPTRRDRWRGIVAGALAALAVMAPWIGYNLTRFEKPEFLSTQFGPLLSAANCDDIWRGHHRSYYSIECTERIRVRAVPPGLDQSEQDAIYRREALEYIGDNAELIPGVVAARLGAILGLYNRELQINIDSVIEGRELALARAGMYSFYAMAILAAAGAVILRRSRRAPVFPLLAPPVMVLATVVLTYASTRFRAAAEVSLCILAAVALEAVWTALRRRTTAPDPSAEGAVAEAAT
jgi:hypothetical protein